MDPKYGETYRELHEKHWWWRARSEFIVERLRRLPQVKDRGSILDVGCGDALFFDRLAEFGEVEGVEPCVELLNPTNPHRHRIHVCPFDENFRPGKQYSLILMLDVLEHLEDPVSALGHVRELLTSDGYFVATVPAFMSLWTNHDVLNHHFTRYTKPRLRQVAEQAGLEIQSELYLYHWTCPLKLGLHLVEPMFRLHPRLPKIPARWINDSLYRISRLEQKTLSQLTMPFGSSLLIVARRQNHHRA